VLIREQEVDSVTGRQVTVKVIRDGREIREIERPLHVVGTRKAVVFRRKLWELKRGNRIVIDEPPLAKKGEVRNEGPRADAETAPDRRIPRPVPKITGGHSGGGKVVSEANYGTRNATPVSGVQDSAGIRSSTAAAAGATDAGSVQLSDEQKAVAYADPTARILVEAGPGTGKTETVAHRLVNLLEQGLKPSQILVLSFSKNAVKTLSARIVRMQSEAVRQVEELRHLSVRTFDAWTFRTLRQINFQPGALLRRAHDANIHELICQLNGENRGAVKALLGGVRHVIVDELQDLSGVRGALVIELLKTLAPTGQKGVGFTVLGDPAQAIYGFAMRNGMEEYQVLTSGALVAELRKLYGSEAEVLTLERNFRAQGKLDPVMRSLRRLLLRRVRGASKFSSMGEFAGRLKALDGELAPAKLLDGGNRSAAILTATNGEAIRVAQRLVENAGELGVAAVRLHTQSQPVVVPAWIGATLGRMKDTSLTRSQFRKIHDFLYGGVRAEQARALEVPPLDVAWGRLARATGVAPDATAIDLKVLRSRLGWTDLLPDDDGVQRAVLHVMTIYQSKGMEFDSVAIMTDSLGSRELETEAEQVEAANVIFVGMTRAAKQLFRVGKGQTYGPLFPGQFANDRKRWFSWHHGWVNIETGIPGDVDATGFIDRKVFGDDGEAAPEQAVADCQDFLATSAAALRGQKVMLCKWPVPGTQNKFVYRIHLQEDREAGRLLGVTTDHLTLDLLHLLWKKGYGLPSKIFNLRISDVVTLGLQQEIPDTAAQPWATSGLWLGVNLYGTGDFQTFKRR
jgi:hypothetical protein